MNFIRVTVSASLVLLLTLVAGCADNANSQSTRPEPPAKLTGPAAKEAELATVTLTPEAENRLGIALQTAAAGQSSDVRRFSGEVTAPLGNSFMVASPVSGVLQG